METGVIIALITAGASIITSISLGILQFRNTKAQAKKSEVEADVALINAALTTSKETMLIIKSEVEEKRQEIILLKQEIVTLKQEVEEAIKIKMELQVKLDHCIKCLESKGIICEGDLND